MTGYDNGIMDRKGWVANTRAVAQEWGEPEFDDCIIGNGVFIPHPGLVNLYGCEIGDDSIIGPFVEIQRGAKLGVRVHVCSHTFICSLVTIGDRCFVGHGVMFTNDICPVVGLGPAYRETRIADDVSIGSGCTILPVRIGHGAIVGAGAVVTSDIPDLVVVVGNPARIVRRFSDLEERNRYVADYSSHANS